MEVKSISYMRRVNLGNYEHEEITAQAVLAEGESLEKSATQLKAEVMAFLSGKKSPEPKKVEEKKPEPKKEEPKVEEKKPEPKKEEPKVEEKKPEPKKAPVKKKATAKPKKEEYIPYDRENDEHKEELGFIFDRACPTWKEDIEVRKKCAAISRQAVGQDFMGTDGIILTEFEEFVSALLDELDDDI